MISFRDSKLGHYTEKKFSYKGWFMVRLLRYNLREGVCYEGKRGYNGGIRLLYLYGLDSKCLRRLWRLCWSSDWRYIVVDVLKSVDANAHAKWKIHGYIVKQELTNKPTHTTCETVTIIPFCFLNDSVTFLFQCFFFIFLPISCNHSLFRLYSISNTIIFPIHLRFSFPLYYSSS